MTVRALRLLGAAMVAALILGTPAGVSGNKKCFGDDYKCRMWCENHGGLLCSSDSDRPGQWCCLLLESASSAVVAAAPAAPGVSGNKKCFGDDYKCRMWCENHGGLLCSSDSDRPGQWCCLLLESASSAVVAAAPAAPGVSGNKK
eukprot:RCo033572